MDRRTLVRRSVATTVLAVGAPVLARWAIAPAGAAATSGALDDLDLPAVDIEVDDAGFAVPAGVTGGRLLLTIENTGSKPLHFFAARVPDDVTDDQLASEMAADAEPAWFDLSTLPMLGNPDWPTPGGRARGVVDVGAGRWLLVDPLEGRPPALWTVAAGASGAEVPQPTADIAIELAEMAFTGLDDPVPAGVHVWKIANRGAMEHEILVVPVAVGTTERDVIEAIGDLVSDRGDPSWFTPVGGQGIASKGITTWQSFDLAPGTYAAVCMSPLPGEAFKTHAMLGMVKVFAVR